MKPVSIQDIMTKNVTCVTPEQPLLDVKHIYEKDNFHHHIPVEKNGKLVGMISLIDFMYHISGAGLRDDNVVYNKLKVKDIMTPNPFYVTVSASVNDVSKVFTKGKYHAVPVLENDNIVGIVSTVDVIKYFLNRTV